MKNFASLLLVGLVALTVGCSEKTQEIRVDGSPGLDGISMGVDVSSIAPSCSAGGSTIKSFIDANRNSALDIGEVIKQTAVVCNGVNGANGTSVTVAVASASDCANGGLLVNGTAICNGTNGTMGPQGAAGTNGLDGAAGPQGVAGKSAYQTWLDAGNTGDENAFLAALKGATGAAGSNGTNGTNGSNGLSAYQVWLSLGNTGTESQFISAITGPQGTAGQNGLNGTNGTNGSNGTNGTNGKSAYEIWLALGNTGTEAQFIASLKGATGATGATGPQGPQGVSGGVGNVTPVQLCPGDTASYKEQGLIIGSSLYAVYFDKNQPIAFLAVLSPGSYVTTNGSNCTFTYANNGSNITLSNSSGTTTVSLTSSGGSSGGGNSLAGSCSVTKTNDYASAQHFNFAVSGMDSYTSYTLEVKFTNSSTISSVGNSNGGTASFNAPTWTIAPQNSSQGFQFYAYHSATNAVPNVTVAKVKKGSQEMTCTVTN